MKLLHAFAYCLLSAGALVAAPASTQPAEPAKPTSRTVKKIEGWTVRVDDRLLQPANETTGKRALQLLEAKLADIKSVVAPEPLAKLQSVTIVLDLTHGQLHPMQYHPSADWLAEHGYARDLARCVHIPEAADFINPRHNSDQPWCVLHELAHAYHDQVLGFNEPRIVAAFEKFRDSGHGDSTLLVTGAHTRHYALTDNKEFFAEMSEAYFGMNDFFPFNRGELMTAEPRIYELLRTIWGPVSGSEPAAPPEARAKATAVSPAGVDTLFAEWDRPDSPGSALAVIQDGRTVYQRGYGMANLEHAVPITPTTIFNVASVSKQFTAMAVILLAQEGRLSLDDDIRKYIPELADFGKPITIGHLLHHTSGLRDQWELLEYAGWREGDPITQRDVLDMLFRQRELNFSPGERFLYCNSGYTLIAELVQRLSGRSFAEFCRERIIEPLAMNHTHFHDDHKLLVLDRAYSYSPRPGGGFRHSPLAYATTGATSLQTTVEDLARWDHNFYEPTVGGKPAIAEMLRQGKLNGGKSLDYAAGLVIGNYRGLPTVVHSGVDAGFRSVLLRFPGQRFSVIILANLGSIEPAALAHQVTDLYLADKLAPVATPKKTPPATQPPPPTDSSSYAEYAGTYWMPEGLARSFAENQGRLVYMSDGAQFLLREVAPGQFAEEGRDVRYTFTKSPDGHVHQVQRRFGNQAPTTGRKIEDTPLSQPQAQQYTGDFYSPELLTFYRLQLRDGRLLLNSRKDQETMIPMGGDEFLTHFDRSNRDSGDYVDVHFTRDDQGNVTGLTLDTERLKHVRFRRIELPK